MWKKNTSILLLVLVINFTSGLENLQKWNKDSGIATLSCPLDDDPDNPTLLPYDGDCTKFIKCSYGVGYPLNCPRGLHWARLLNRCEAPKVAGCNPNQTTQKPTIGGGGCTFKYQPHPTDCSKVYTCINGVTSELTCPAGLLWDKVNNKCSVLDSC